MTGPCGLTNGILGCSEARYDGNRTTVGIDMDVYTHVKKILGVLLLALVGPAYATGLPDTTIPAGVGVNIHFARGNTQSLDLIASAGIRVVRMDFFWDTIETRKGVYDWSAYDELVRNLEARGLRPYFILDNSNALYEQTRATWVGAYPSGSYVPSPQHPASIAAFAAWAEAAAAHFSGHNVIWEIWNEPNLASFWKPQANATQYSALAASTCSAIRSGDSSAVVVGGAISGFDWTYMTAVLSSGLLNCIDAFSVHPYRSPSSAPETAASDYAQLATLIAQYTPSSRSAKIPIISGEWGYYTTSNGGVSTATQAAYVVRQQLSNLLNGVNLSIWYDWMNDGTDTTNAEHNFGLVNTDLSAKPAYTALQTMTQQLSDYHFQSRLSTGNAADYVLAFVNGSGQVKIVYWTTGTAHGVSLAPLVGTLQLSTVNLSLTQSPQYTDILGVLPGG